MDTSVAVLGILLAINTVFIVLIFFMFRKHRAEMKDVTTHAKAYYVMARTHSSQVRQAADEITQTASEIKGNGGSGISGRSGEIRVTE